MTPKMCVKTGCQKIDKMTKKLVIFGEKWPKKVVKIDKDYKKWENA